MTAKTAIYAACLALAAVNAQAVEVTCVEDDSTNALFCYPPSKIKEKAGIRTAPLYTGGPNCVRSSAYTIAANCSSGVLHVR